MVVIEDLTASFKSDLTKLPVIQDFSLKLQAGKILSLFGPNGCGKTSLVKLLLNRFGYEETEFNLHFSKMSYDKNIKIGYAAQNAAAKSIMEWYSCLDNIALGLALTGLSRHEAQKAAMKRIFGLVEGLPLSNSGAHLSGGERQLAVLAREIARFDPDGKGGGLLIIDEGFSGIDYERRWRAMSWIREWAQRLEISILNVGHEIEQVVAFSDEVIVSSRRPATVAHKIRVNGPLQRGVESLGQGWLISGTEQTQAAFREVLTKE